MTTRERMYCDSCPATAAPDHAERWGKLITRAPTGKMRHADVCPACIAKLHGWANPIVAGEGGLTARQYLKAASA